MLGNIEQLCLVELEPEAIAGHWVRHAHRRSALRLASSRAGPQLGMDPGTEPTLPGGAIGSALLEHPVRDLMGC